MSAKVLGARLSTQEIAHAWRDSEFWPPPGLGCARCHVRPPIVRDVGFGGALCDVCLGLCFGGRDFEWIIGWLGRQRFQQVRDEKRKAALKAWNEKRDKSLAMEYRHEYGVWLLEIPEP